MAQHIVIPSDYPDEPNLHIMRHDDGVRAFNTGGIFDSETSRRALRG